MEIFRTTPIHETNSPKNDNQDLQYYFSLFEKGYIPIFSETNPPKLILRTELFNSKAKGKYLQSNKNQVSKRKKVETEISPKKNIIDKTFSSKRRKVKSPLESPSKKTKPKKNQIMYFDYYILFLSSTN